jgi:hypothetical protein
MPSVLIIDDTGPDVNFETPFWRGRMLCGLCPLGKEIKRYSRILRFNHLTKLGTSHPQARKMGSSPTALGGSGPRRPIRLAYYPEGVIFEAGPRANGHAQAAPRQKASWVDRWDEQGYSERVEPP